MSKHIEYIDIFKYRVDVIDTYKLIISCNCCIGDGSERDDIGRFSFKLGILDAIDCKSSKTLGPNSV